MKTIKLFILFLVSVCLASCGGKGIKPTTEKIQGPLGKYYEVVDKNYKIDDFHQVAIEFKRIAVGGPKNASLSEPTFTVEYLDADGNVLDSSLANMEYDKEELGSVFSLGLNETKSITFYIAEIKDATSFRVSSKWDKSKEERAEETESSVFDM